SDLGGAEPVDLLPFDPDESGRAPVLDEAGLLRSFGTATRSADGTVTSVPAGEAVRAALREAAPGAPPAGDAAADPRIRDGQPADRQIFGTDDRMRIADTRRFPYSAIGMLQLSLGPGRFGLCSGTLIGPRTVL